jgi:hypothetical protein
MSLKIEALRARYTAQRLEAMATLEVYMRNSVGIGEHPQIIDEMDKLIGDIESAEGKIEILDTVFINSKDSNSEK